MDNLHKPIRSKLFVLALTLIGMVGVSHAATTITGAGATFPYPIYSQWAQTYQTQTKIKLNYQSIGSGAGIKQIEAKTVDFGASDKPLSADDLKQYSLIQFPAVIGGIVPIVNLPGISSGQLKLSGDVLANIFLGKIKNWNDPAIVKLNPTLTLPNQAITIVHRSDGSGTTYLFTTYLSKSNSDWKAQIGSDTAVSWPQGMGGKGNEGISVYVKQIPGAIGYVEYAYAKLSNASVVQLKNKAGNFVQPTLENFKAAAVSANWSATDFRIDLIDQAGANSWPIVGATYILMNTAADKPDQSKAVLSFFDWAYKNGGDAALALDYIPMPTNAVQLIENAWKAQIKDKQGKALWQ